MFKVGYITEDRLIYITCECSELSDEFVVLLLAYKTMRNGEVKEYSEEYQFQVTNDPLQLIFQWDSCFVITVIVPSSTDITLAKITLEKLCKCINNIEV